MSKHEICTPCFPPHDDCNRPCVPPHDDCNRPCVPPNHICNGDCGSCDHTSSCKHFGGKVTKHFHLPLWKANTVTSWLYGINKAMIQIDELFHMFALRTSIDGTPDELSNQVILLEKKVKALSKDVCDNTSTLADMTKVIANILADNEIENQKYKILREELSTIKLRLDNLTLSGGNSDEKLKEVEVRLNSLSDRIDALENAGDAPGTGDTGDTPGTGENGGDNNG